MKISRFVGGFLLLITAAYTHAQSFNHFYPDNNYNDIAGYDNAVFDAKSSTYFLVEYDRQIDVAFNSGLHVKKVDEFGNLIDERYFITDTAPYSGHYISGVQVQGDEIVVILNRGTGFPIVTDVFVFRIKKDLTGTPTSERLHLGGLDETFNSVKINEIVPYGSRLVFTGSVFTRGDFNEYASASNLLMGFINADGSIHYQTYQYNATLVEGLSILANAKSSTLFVSCRHVDDKAKKKKDVPLIVKFRTSGNNFYQYWTKRYPTLRVDTTNYSNYNEGIEVPIIQSFTEKNVPAFIARDSTTQNIVFVPFDPSTGVPLAADDRYFKIPSNVELIDAVRMNDTKSGFAVLFTRKEEYNLVNTESYLMTVNNPYSFFANVQWRNLTTPVQTNAMLARRILIPEKGELAIAGLVNNEEYPLSGLYRASLMKSDDLSFDCVTAQSLMNPKKVVVPYENIILKLTYVAIIEEERTMPGSVSVATITYDLCDERLFEEDKAAQPTITYETTEMTVDNEIQVYPNPSNTVVNIKLPLNTESARTLIIRSMTGAIVHQQQIARSIIAVQVNTANFAEGVYSISVMNDKTIEKATRLVVRH